MEAHRNARSLVPSLACRVFCESRAHEAILIFGSFYRLSGDSESCRSEMSGGRISCVGPERLAVQNLEGRSTAGRKE